MASNAGEQLREARELKGLTVEDVAARLRIPARYVRAIEQGDSGVLPEPTFVRGYVKAYARELGLDADAMVAELAPAIEVKAPRPLLAVDGGTSGRKSGAARAPNFRAGSSRRRPWLVAAVIVVVVVLLLVLAFLALRSPSSSPVEVTVAPAASTGTVAPVVMPPPVVGGGKDAVVTAIRLPPAPSSSPAPAAAVAGTPVALPLPAASGTQPLALPQPPAAAPAAVPAPAGASSPEVKEVPVPRRGLYIRFRGESWVEVRDVDNVVLHTSVQSAGSVLSLEGKAPLTVTLGDSGAADLWYNGARQQNRGGNARVNRIIVGQAAR